MYSTKAKLIKMATKIQDGRQNVIIYFHQYMCCNVKHGIEGADVIKLRLFMNM